MSDYCEIPEFYSGRWVSARKEHQCVECGAPIKKGEFHGVFTGKWDGDLSMHRQHIECEDACVFIRDHLQGGDCICFGELFEVASDMQTPRTDSKVKDFRKIMARVRFRKKKGRLPAFLGPISLQHPLPKLQEYRARKWL